MAKRAGNWDYIVLDGEHQLVQVANWCRSPTGAGRQLVQVDSRACRACHLLATPDSVFGLPRAEPPAVSE